MISATKAQKVTHNSQQKQNILTMLQPVENLQTIFTVTVTIGIYW